MKTIPKSSGVSVGLGDDAAVIDSPGSLAVAADMLVEGVHYIKGEATPSLIGAKAVNRNFSDMAAMGLAPSWLIVSAAITKNTGEEFIKSLVIGMVDAAKAFDVGIIGGDTSSSPSGLVINITVLGKTEDLKPVLRSGAKPGDLIYVTGQLGGSLFGKHLNFTPRVKEGLYLNRNFNISAMIDVSDGLSLDLWRILEASDKGALIDGLMIPVSEDAKKAAATSGRTPVEHALSDGEDFELIFTLSPDEATKLESASDLFFKVTRIGEIKEDTDDRMIIIDDQRRPLWKDGYDHTF